MGCQHRGSDGYPLSLSLKEVKIRKMQQLEQNSLDRKRGDSPVTVSFLVGIFLGRLCTLVNLRTGGLLSPSRTVTWVPASLLCAGINYRKLLESSPGRGVWREDMGTLRLSIHKGFTISNRNWRRNKALHFQDDTWVLSTRFLLLCPQTPSGQSIRPSFLRLSVRASVCVCVFNRQT